MMKKQWVLVTADGPQLRDPLVAIRALAAAGYHPAVALSCESSLATASRHCLRVIRVPSWRDREGYAAAVGAELARDDYLTVLPCSEVGLLALGGAAEHLVDKAALAERGAELGVPAPPSRLFTSAAELLEAADELPYPVVVKPAVHTYFASRVDSPAGLASTVREDGPVLVQPYLNDAMHALSGVVWNGELVAATHERWFRIWRFDCGVATAAETIGPDLDLEARMLRLLNGYEGYFHAQFVGPYLVDINLRVHTSHPLSVAAGANLVATYCDVLRGDRVEPVRGRPGVFFRWIEGDIRHVIKAVRLGRMGPVAALRALRPRDGTAHSTESLKDPGPMMSRLWYGLRAAAGLARRDGNEHATT
jgi:hypothetical protein